MNPSARPFLRKQMTLERQESLKRALEDWRGALVHIESYTAHSEYLRLELRQEGVLGCLRITCTGCTHLSGPTSWDDAALTFEASPEGPFRLVDARAGFSATCDLMASRNDSEDPRLLERAEFKAFLAGLPGVRFLRLAEEIERGITPRVAATGVMGLFAVPSATLREVDPRRNPEPFQHWLREQTQGLDFTGGCLLWTEALERQTGGTPWLEVELEHGLDSLLPWWRTPHCGVTLVYCSASRCLLGVFEEEDRWSLYRQSG